MRFSRLMTQNHLIAKMIGRCVKILNLKSTRIDLKLLCKTLRLYEFLSAEVLAFYLDELTSRFNYNFRIYGLTY